MNNRSEQSWFRLFLGFYSIANIGAHVAFVPLLSLLLPLKAEQIAPDDKLVLLSITLFIGSLMASISNIAAGALSDRIYARTRSRAGQIITSLLFVLLSFYFFWKANDWTSLILSIVFFQWSFNFLFSPLGALLTDRVPDQIKGRAAALLNLGLPIATLSIAFLSLAYWTNEGVKLIWISAMVIVPIVPLVLFIGHPSARVVDLPESQPIPSVNSVKRLDFLWAWGARFFVQFSGAVMAGYLLYFLIDVVQYSKLFPGQRADQAMGKLTLAATPVTILIGILAGMFSDRSGVRKPFLIISSIFIGCAILTMTLFPAWPVIFLSYLIFVCGLTIFLTTDTALVAQLLSGDQARARKLGLMNLTNTIPAIIAPAIALILSRSAIQSDILIYLMQLAGLLAFCAAAMASRIKTIA